MLKYLLIILLILLICRAHRDGMSIRYCKSGNFHPHSFYGRVKNWAAQMGWTYDEDNVDLYLPCHIHGSYPTDDSVMGMGFSDHPELTDKDTLWKNIVSVHGEDHASKIMPKSWTTYDSFYRDYVPGQTYILKKNLERKMGLKICKTKEEVREGFKYGEYPMVQKYIDPFLINDRKINIRVYMLLFYKDDKFHLYIHENMIPIPSVKPYDVESTDMQSHFTSLNMENNCHIYDKFPKNMKDVSKHCWGVPHKINKIAKDIKKVCEQRMLNMRNNTFHLLGADYIIDSDNNVMILEINKNPKITNTCPHHDVMKEKMVRDIYRTIGLVNDGETSKFYEI